MTRFAPATIAVLLLVSHGVAGPISYTDNFEAATFNSFWTPSYASGSAFLTGAQVHGGKQAAQFNSVNTGQTKNIFLGHFFAAPVFGRTSVWVYDTGADVASSNYLGLILGNSQTNQSRAISTYDYDLGPGQNGSTYFVGTPAEYVTGIDRTQAWHEFVIDTTPNSTRFLIDGQLVLTQPAGFSFDQIKFGISGPSFRPAWTGYFDDFSFAEYAPTPTPEPASAVVFGLGAVGALGTVLRLRKVQTRAG